MFPRVQLWAPGLITVAAWLSISSACGGGGGPAAPGDLDAAADQAGADARSGSGGGAAAGGGSGGAGGQPGTDVAPETASDLGQSPDGAAEQPPGEAATLCMACADYAPAMQTGRVQTAALNQLSGIAASHKNPGVLFVHNDRNTPEFWAVSEAGALLATFMYTGATVRDVEDIAVGACPSGSCVYLADIGANLGARPDFTIVRLPEPTVASNGAAAPVSVAAEKLVYTYPDGGQHNAESLLIDPRTGTLYIIDKVDNGVRSTVYRLPAGFGGAPVVAIRVVELPVPMANDTPTTAADAHPCGTGFILRTNNTAYEFRIAATAPFEDAFRAPPVVVPVGQEQQGEGITYQANGRGFYTNTEGAMAPIHHTACR